MHHEEDPPSLIGSALRRAGTVRRYSRGQALFVEGDRSGRVFVLESGWVLVTCTSPLGRDVVLDVRGPGDILGELSALDDKPRVATALAVDDVQAVSAPNSVLAMALRDAAGARELIDVLAARVRDADRRLLEYAALDTLGRVSGRLLELAERFGAPTPEGTVVELALSQEQLASWCGASRESTVKALRALRELGHITTARRRVTVHDLPALRLRSHGRSG